MVKIKGLAVKTLDLSTSQSQQNLFHVERQIEFQDVEMGVLESGVPYLTGRGLAKMCGIDHGPFHRLTANWQDERHKPRGKVISQLLEESNYFEDSLYLKAEFNGQAINAFTEPVCLALLEYYAFLADEKREKAVNAFRAMARTTFRTFIYEAVGYSPERQVLDNWRHFHDRIDLNYNAVPDGYFSVFREIAGMIVSLIRAEIIINDKVIPDVSVGIVWSTHWKNNLCDESFGARVTYDHNYPEYYPQSLSNPQEAWAYPDSALAEFRVWFKREYIASKFPKYMLSQSSKGKITTALAQKAVDAIAGKVIAYKPK
jgi:hypothetical protein